MATQIGFISAIIGTATATTPDGATRQLQAGDKVYQNELITTGPGGAIEIQFSDGSIMDLGRQSQAMLDTSVLDPAMPATAAAETADNDVEAIQQALLQGEDPTVAGEATAAGPGAGVGGSEGGSSFVSRDYLNPEVIPTSGFDTIGVSNAFDEPENLNLIEVDEGEPLVPPTEITVSLSRELSPETEGVFENQGITYVATLSEASSGDITVTLSSGLQIFIPAGELTGFVNSQPQGDDVYIDPETVAEVISEISGGRENEVLSFDDSEIQTDIFDTIDTTTVTLNDVNVAEDGSITYSASVDHAPQGNLSITLSNGVVIVIPDGTTTGSSDPQPAQGDDVYLDGESFEVSIASTSGGNYEALDTSDTATVTISDTIDTVTATLSTSTSEISESGGDITYIIILTGGPGNIDPDTDLVFNLANGEQVTILAGQTSGSFTRTYSDGEITTQTSINNSIDSVASGGDEYENLQTAGSTTVDVDYQPVINNLTPKAQGGDAIVDEDDLSADRGVGESAGTDGSESTTASGTFFINAPDGLGSLTIGGQAVITAGSFTAISFTTALGNTLSITGYDVTTGEVSYEYKLEDNTETHGPVNNGENSVFEDFAVVLKDTDGDEATDTLSVQIVDDVPAAEDDTGSLSEDDASVSGNVVNDSDVFGADGALVVDAGVTAVRTGAENAAGTNGTIGVGLEGSYGTLTLNADGSYTYALTADVDYLDNGESETDEFTYTITDGDNDTDQATLTITITGTNDAPELQVDANNKLVNEKGLSTGSGELVDGDAANDSDTSEQVTGSFTFSDAEGLADIASLTIAGTTLTLGQGGINSFADMVGQSFSTDHGEVELTAYDGNGTFSYRYTLGEAIDHVDGNGTNIADDADSFTITVTDDGGLSDTVTVNIDVVDDVPEAEDDGPAVVTEDGASVVDGNVLDNDNTYADQPAAFVGWSADGFNNAAAITALNTYGTLVQNTDGSWSYKLDNSQAATQALDAADQLSYDLYYTMTDADGDESVAKLTITINGADDNATVDAGGGETVYEAGLPEGSANDDSDLVTGGTVAVSASDGILSVTIGGTVFSFADVQGFDGSDTVDTGQGILTLQSYSGDAFSGTITYHYALSATIDNDSASPSAPEEVDGDSYLDVVAIEVDGVGGSNATDDLEISIVDDVPEAEDDGPAAVIEDVTSVIDGNVLDNDNAYADQPAAFVGWTADGFDNSAAVNDLNTYGTLEQDNDGSWSYTLDNSRTATQALDSDDALSYDLYYTMADADGDESVAKLTININGADDNAAVVTAEVEGPDAIVYEAGLNPDGSDAGSDSETVTGSFDVSASDGILNVVVGGSTFTLAEVQAFAGTNGVFNTGEGTLTLTGYSGDNLNGTISYSYTLNATIDNDSKVPAGDDAVTLEHFDDSVEISVNGIGGTTARDDLVIRAIDDVPLLSAVESAVLNNDENGYAAGSSTLEVGADQPATADLSANIAGWDGLSITHGESVLTSGGNTVYYYVDPANPGVLLAYTSETDSPYTDGVDQSLVFTLSFDGNGDYIIDMNGTLDAATQTFGATFNANIGGNQDYLHVTDTGNIYKPGDVIPIGESIVMTVDSSEGGVNSSTQGLAPDNQFVDGDELMYFTFPEPVVSAAFSIDIQGNGTPLELGWVVYGKNAQGELTTESGTTTFTENSLTEIPSNLVDITRVDLSAAGEGAFRVNGTSIVDRIESDPVNESFEITIIDADGDPTSSTLNVQFDPVVLSEFVVGSNENDTQGTTDLYTVPQAGAGTISGDAANDILVGDPGGTTLQPGSTANIVLVLDTSTSMVTETINFNGQNVTRLEAMKTSVATTLQDLSESGAQVKVHIVTFGTNANSLGTWNLTAGAGLVTALSAVAGISVDNLQYTNYEAGLVEANDWINSNGANAPFSAADVNKLVFVSDGEPNYALNNSGNPVSVSSSQAMQHVQGNYNPSGKSNDDNVSEINLIETVQGGEQPFTIEAIGINVSNTALNLLSNVEGSGGSATNVTTGQQFSAALGELSGATTISASLGDDTILGGDGADIVFGDAMFTDLLAGHEGLSTPDAAGWLVFQQLEAALDNDWTREDTIAYIQANHEALAQESDRDGGDDIIEGGAGDDIIYGQEGNDQISGGADNDLLSGGTGADIFIWNNGDEGTPTIPAHDVIIDFNTDEGDSLDLADMLQGEEDGVLTDYLNVQETDDDVVISVSPDGGDVTQVITLTDTTLTNLGAGGLSEQVDIINKLVADGTLHVDQS